MSSTGLIYFLFPSELCLNFVNISIKYTHEFLQLNITPLRNDPHACLFHSSKAVNKSIDGLDFGDEAVAEEFMITIKMVYRAAAYEHSMFGLIFRHFMCP